MMTIVNYDFGPDARNRLDHTHHPGHDGALAALETFYYALNNADLDVLSAVWSDDAYAQLNNPVGGILRSGSAIVELYQRIFASGIDLQVTFTDAASYLSGTTAVFAGREVGSYRGPDRDRHALDIRTTRVIGWHRKHVRWAQLHHHGSIDDATVLADYQAAVRGTAAAATPT
jgi:ketosteroid isomerase-like protein